MEEIKLGLVEARFAEIVWQNEPLTTRELVGLCEKELEWKRTTTYTVLKKLCEKGIFQNQDGVVTSLISKEELQSAQSEKFVEDTFAGSLPQFLTAFARRKKLSKQEIDEIQRFIDENRG